jgi:hypothetical protein
VIHRTSPGSRHGHSPAANAAAPPDRTSGGRLLAGGLLKIAVSGGLLAILWSRIDATRLWSYAAAASPAWLAAALAAYGLMIAASAWRWGLLLDAQAIHEPAYRLVASYLVATFFNNFLPSNIGGDVVRIRDTAGAAGSKTLATTIVLIDRGIGLLGLVFVAAVGATWGGRGGRTGLPFGPVVLWVGLLLGLAASARAVLDPAGVGRLLRPLRLLHAEWVGTRIERITSALAEFRRQPGALAGCFVGAIAVQVVLVAFYLFVAYAIHVPVSAVHLAVIVPVSFVVQMVPISLNGFGVREATFAFYFTRLGLPIESGLTVSLLGAALVMLFSLTGAAAYLLRRR